MSGIKPVGMLGTFSSVKFSKEFAISSIRRIGSGQSLVKCKASILFNLLMEVSVTSQKLKDNLMTSLAS